LKAPDVKIKIPATMLLILSLAVKPTADAKKGITIVKIKGATNPIKAKMNPAHIILIVKEIMYLINLPIRK
jgi:hypothetical protein